MTPDEIVGELVIAYMEQYQLFYNRQMNKTVAYNVARRLYDLGWRKFDKCVDPEWIKAQRKAGWPDMHPEDYCHICGCSNPTWSAPQEEWNLATEKWRAKTGREGICCPKCFETMYEEATGEKITIIVMVWRGSWDRHGGVNSDIMQAREAAVEAVMRWTEKDSYSADERIRQAHYRLKEVMK